MSDPNTTTTAVAAPAAGQVARQDFGGTELAVGGETAASAAAAQATAIVQARYVMALRRPRDWDDVRVRIMKEVERPGFAAVAWYFKPVGDGVQGLSIRFAEAAMRCMGNLLPEAPIVYDDPKRRILRVTLTDLESNLTWSKDVIIEKTVERRFLKKGQTALQVRTNSKGEITYLVAATEDELGAKEGALVSKATRTLALRILPGDIQDEARKRILEIRSGEAAKDPDAARKKVVDAFALLNVLPSELKRYLRHDIGTASPAEIAELRDVYTKIAAGEATWAAVIAERLDEDEPAAEDKPKAGLDGVTEKLETKAAEGNAPAAPAVVTGRPSDGPFCPDHPAQTIVNGDGSRACYADGCKWTAPAPQAERIPGEDDDAPGPTPAAAVQAVKAVAAAAGDTTKAPEKTKGPRQGRLD